ncbi:cytochrome P450 [Ceratobasidium sp. AG-I]|nr:cytochrome P450 [Ceratobasidium sp. AG-I]
MTQSALHENASADLQLKIVKHSRLSLQRLLHNPSDFYAEFRWMTGSIILSSVYGYETNSRDDNLFKVMENSNRHLGEAGLAGNFYVNTIPWLKYVPWWFPGAGWKRKCGILLLPASDAGLILYKTAGIASPSILEKLLTKLAADGPPSHGLEEEEDRIKWVVGTLFIAGSETTWSSIMTFLLAMILHPEIQHRAQAELDSELGGSRLPELTDRDSLPYINMILKEVMRWRAVTPLAVPHACAQDDEYKGYRIPKGAIEMYGNRAYDRAISNDPRVYLNPEEFNPDRFIDPSVPEAPAFGSCPGSTFAEATLFITVCTILSTFNISPVLDQEGCEIIPKAKMSLDKVVR